jgi:hypothetical protein
LRISEYECAVFGAGVAQSDGFTVCGFDPVV